jgi:hypothetical protein
LGGLPYQVIPQHYIDITERHNNLDLSYVTSGSTGFIMHEGKCSLYPRFLIGYNYLVITGVQTTMAFEPINSTNIDKWFKAVVNEILSAQND